MNIDKLINKLESYEYDDDNFPHMEQEIRVPVGLALQAADKLKEIRIFYNKLERYTPEEEVISYHNYIVELLSIIIDED
jgi:hypothetical protein